MIAGFIPLAGGAIAAASHGSSECYGTFYECILSPMLFAAAFLVSVCIFIVIPFVWLMERSCGDQRTLAQYVMDLGRWWMSALRHLW